MALLVKSLSFTGLAPGTVAGLVPWLLVSGQPTGGGSRALAGLLFALGLAICARRATTRRIPSPGRPPPGEPSRGRRAQARGSAGRSSASGTPVERATIESSV